MPQTLTQTLIRHVQDLFNAYSGERLDSGVLVLLSGITSENRAEVTHFPLCAEHFPTVQIEYLYRRFSTPLPLQQSVFYPGISGFMVNGYSENTLTQVPQYSQDGFDWETYISDTSLPIHLLGLPPGCQRYYAFPVMHFYTCVAWVIHEKDLFPDPGLCYRLGLPFQIDFTRRLFTFFDEAVLESLPDEDAWLEWYAKKLANILLPGSLKYGSADWQPFVNEFSGRDYVLQIRSNPDKAIAYGFPGISFPTAGGNKRKLIHQSSDFKETEHQFATILDQHHQSVYTFWKALRTRRDIKLVDRLEQIQKELKVFEEKTGELWSEQKKLLEKFPKAGDPEPATVKSKYVFYKDSVSWRICFNGDFVNARGNEMGLQSIHQLLRHPGKIFYPNDLEVVKKKRKGNIIIQASNSFSIEYEPRFKFVNPEDEESIKKTFLKYFDERPEDSDKFLEDQIKYWSNLLYYADTLKGIQLKPQYIQWFELCKEHLQNKVFEYEEKAGDSRAVERVLKDSQIIKKSYDYKLQSRRLRQSVHKNVKNAIDNLNSDAIKAYFEKTLKYGARSSYTPLQDSPDWKLLPD